MYNKHLVITQQHREPWQHWIADNFLNEQTLAEVKSIPHQLQQQTAGKRVGQDRLFIDDAVQHQYPHLHALWRDMHNGATQQYFEHYTKQRYSGLFPRIEVISDIGEFYLERHHDLLEKRLTALVYTDHEHLWPGTTIGDDHVVESRDNRCMFFVPSTDTWHSYPKTTFDCVRRALQINYWTYSV